MSQEIEKRVLAKRARLDRIRKRIKDAQAQLQLDVDKLPALVRQFEEKLQADIRRRSVKIEVRLAALQAAESLEAAQKLEQQVAKAKPTVRALGPVIVEQALAELRREAGGDEATEAQAIPPKRKPGRPPGSTTKNRRPPSEVELAAQAVAAKTTADIAGIEASIGDLDADEPENEMFGPGSTAEMEDFLALTTPGDGTEEDLGTDAEAVAPDGDGEQLKAPPVEPLPPEASPQGEPAQPAAPASMPVSVEGPAPAGEPIPDPVKTAPALPAEPPAQVAGHAARREAAARDPVVDRLTTLVSELLAYESSLGKSSPKHAMACFMLRVESVRVKELSLVALMEGHRPNAYRHLDRAEWNSFLKHPEAPAGPGFVKARARIRSLFRAVLNSP